MSLVSESYYSVNKTALDNVCFRHRSRCAASDCQSAESTGQWVHRDDTLLVLYKYTIDIDIVCTTMS